MNTICRRIIAAVVSLSVLCVLGTTAAVAAAAPKIVFSPKKVGPGDILLVTVKMKDSGKAVQGSFLGKQLHFNQSKSGWKAVVGIDLNTEPREYVMKLTIDGRNISRRVRISKKRYPLQRLTLPEDKVTLSPENEARAEREQQKMAALWPVDSLRVWEGNFIDPLPGKEVTTQFGVRRTINNIPKSPHSGVDLAADLGEPVKAPNDGVVVLVDDQFFSGNSLVLDHGQGIYTMFFHLSKINVTYGQAVMKGDVIGLVGATGRLTGPCLHWGARVQGAKVDPLELIRLKLE